MSDIDWEAKVIAAAAALPPLPGEQVVPVLGGRLPEAGEVVGRLDETAAETPGQWLRWHQIPLREVPATSKELFGGKASASFWHQANGGEHVNAWVCIPTGANIDEPKIGWCVWHEIGHAMDYVGLREGKLIATPHGLYSTNHIELLRKYQEAIIQWTPNPDRGYKTKPEELWAEVVACAVVAPLMVPGELYAAVKEDLRRRRVPLVYAEDVCNP